MSDVSLVNASAVYFVLLDLFLPSFDLLMFLSLSLFAVSHLLQMLLQCRLRRRTKEIQQCTDVRVTIARLLPLCSPNGRLMRREPMVGALLKRGDKSANLIVGAARRGGIEPTELRCVDHCAQRAWRHGRHGAIDAWHSACRVGHELIHDSFDLHSGVIEMEEERRRSLHSRIDTTGLRSDGNGTNAPQHGTNRTRTSDGSLTTQEQ